MTQINANILKNFIIKTVGADKIHLDHVNKYGLDNDDVLEANKDENNYLELDEIMEDSNLYAQFATMYEEEQDAKSAEIDKEKEKEKATRVKDKNGAGV